MTPNPNSVFGDVIDWFLHRGGDRRQRQRRNAAFHLWWLYELPDKTKPGIGLEVSATGLVFIFPENIAAPEYTLICSIREKKIRLRARTVRTDAVEHKGAKWTRYQCEFTGIAADDWDLIVRYVNEVPEPDRRKIGNQEVTETVDDAYRLLPMAIQNKIMAMLIAQKKLEAPKPGVSPLLKLFYGGASKKGDGTVAHRFNVHSRIKVNDETMAYDTRFLVDESGAVAILK
ncbi:MAG: PilZ domain-containing protein [Candidatus Eremiobacteraeota bacterium]|nr:PilZ domain-containing protein [Candidatus Eremiobacteraeota bacterium]